MCEKHFDPNDIKVKYGLKQLDTDALPRFYLPEKREKRPEIIKCVKRDANCSSKTYVAPKRRLTCMPNMKINAQKKLTQDSKVSVSEVTRSNFNNTSEFLLAGCSNQMPASPDATILIKSESSDDETVIIENDEKDVSSLEKASSTVDVKKEINIQENNDYFDDAIAEATSNLIADIQKTIACNEVEMKESVISENDNHNTSSEDELHFDSEDIVLKNRLEYFAKFKVASRVNVHNNDIIIDDQPLAKIRDEKPNKTYSSKSRLACMLSTEIDVKEENFSQDSTSQVIANQSQIDEEIGVIEDEVENGSAKEETYIVKEEADTMKGEAATLKAVAIIAQEKAVTVRDQKMSLKEEINVEEENLYFHEDGTENISNAEITSKTHHADSGDKNNTTNFTYIKKQKMLIPAPKTPIEYFQLFMSDSLLTDIIKCNKHMLKKKWINISLKELKVFLGLVLHMGTFKFEDIKNYFSTGRLFRANFNKYMVKARFLNILKFIRFSDSSGADHLETVQPVIDNFNRVMRESYSPCKELLVEEYVLQVTLLNSTPKFFSLPEEEDTGLTRLYLIREPCGTVLKIHLLSHESKREPFDKVFLSIARDQLDVGHTFYFKSSQTSFDLAKKLIERKTHCCGRLPKDAPNIPRSVVDADLDVYDSKSVEIDGIHICKWRMTEEKEITYLTTEAPKKTVKIINHQRKQTMQPASFMNMQQKTQIEFTGLLAKYCPMENQSMLWQVRIFIIILLMSVINAHRLFNKFSGSHMEFHEFRMIVIKSLLPSLTQPDSDNEGGAGPHRLERVSRPLLENGVYTNLQKKGCKSCFENLKKFRCTIYECRGCPGAPGLCVKCFCDIHC